MKTLAALTILFAARVAAAQPSMTPPSSVPPAAPTPPQAMTPPSEPVRHGIVIGADLGMGAMGSSNGITSCDGCPSQTAASLSGQIGAMVSPRAALMLGFQLTAKSGTPQGQEPQVTHGQTVVLIEGAYWVSRKVWVLGGLGAAHLTNECDAYCTSQDLDHGGSLEGGVGYELISGPRFALDARFRLMATSYKNLQETVTTPTLAVGVRWF